MSKYVFGVDVGGTTTKIGMFDWQGNLLLKWEIATQKGNNGQQILPNVAQSIESTMGVKQITRSDVIGVGIGTPGPVDATGTVHRAGNLGWGIINVPEVLGGLLNLPVKAGNDANIAAYGEMWQGSGKGYRNMVAVTLGTGVGGGIIANGQIVTGVIGAGGEIGHIHIEDNEQKTCGCGCRGCLEQYASATGIARLAEKHLAKTTRPSILRTKEELSAKTVFDAVRESDDLAVEIAREFGEYLGKGLAIIAAVVNPEVFVIGGGVSNAGEILFDYIRPAFSKYAFRTIRDTEFKLASLGNDAGIYGAAGLFLAR